VDGPLKKFVLTAAGSIAVTAAAAWVIAWLGPLATWSPVSWSNFWTVFNNLVLLATLAVVSYYTYETHELRIATARGNALSVRPIMVLTGNEKGLGAENKGTGPAMNVSAYVWFGNVLRVTPLKGVRAVIPVNDGHDFPAGEQVGIEDFKLQHPDSRGLIGRLSQGESGVAVVYGSVDGTLYYSYYNSSNSQSYGAFMQHGELTDII
jgi:hypothetical protein